MRVEEKEYTGISIFDETGKIDNEMMLIIQRAGGGKSLASESILEEFHDNGYIVISLTDVKDEWELCYSMFEPQAKYHLNILKREGKSPTKKKVEIYHPFTFNIPKTNLPKLNLFTIPLKSLDRQKLSFIGETDSETDSVRLLQDGIESLQKNSNIYDLIHHVQRKARTIRKKHFGKEIVQADKDTFFLETSQKGTMTNVSEIASWFKPFLKDYFLTPDDFKLNLDVEKIFNNQESYHCLSTNWIKDEKRKYFTIFCFFDEIMKNIQKSKYPICFLIEEVAKLTPYKSEGFKKFLANYLRDKLLTMRSKGRGCSALMTSQVFFDIDEKLREKASQVFFGNLKGVADIDRIAKGLKLRGDPVEQLRTMARNEYLMMGEEENGAFRFLFPSHCHAEPRYNFIEMYSKFYRDRMTKYSDVIDEVKVHLKEIEKHYQLKVQEESKRKISEAKDEFEKASSKEKVEKELLEIKQKIKDRSDMSRDEKINQCLELRKKEPNISVRKIAEILGISKSTVNEYFKIVKQRENLPKI